MKKNFEDFQDFYKSLNTKVRIISLTETWANDNAINHNSLFQLEGYILVHQIRKNRQGGGSVIFIRDSLLYKLHNDFSINCEDIESLSIEILNSQTRNIIFNVIYRPPNGDLNVCETFFKKSFQTVLQLAKMFFLQEILILTSSTLKQTKKFKVL